MDILQFIPESLVILVISLEVLGIFLKKSNIKDSYIPTVLLGMSVLSSCLLLKSFDILSVIQGILCWGVAVGIHQTFIVQPKK